MTLILNEVKAPKVDYGRVDDGTYLGRIVSVVDLGLQPQTDWQTHEPTDPKERVMITLELPTERIEMPQEDGTTVSRPRWIGREYTISTYDQSNLMKLISAIAPNATSLAELLNIPCMVQVGSTKNGNAKITGVMPCPKGMDVPPLENDSLNFDFSHPDLEEFKKLPAWMQTKIKEALNYTGFADEAEEAPEKKPAKAVAKPKAAAIEEDFDDDVPFA
jgi:hypothetical protein